jgi:hypothetical protein
MTDPVSETVSEPLIEHFPTTELTVPSRFCGPKDSGNGGWTAGALAATIPGRERADRCRSWPAIEVTLRQPPPLDVPLAVEHPSAGLAVLARDGVRVAEARVVEGEVTPVEAVPAEEAHAAMATYPGLRAHPFPTCFACGTGRAEGDGLRIFPGLVSPAAGGEQRVASTWTPAASVGEDFHEYLDEVPRAGLPVTWAALDCTGGWAADLEERMMVLGRMTAEIDALPAIGEEHDVVGQLLGAEGRKSFTASTLYDADGRIVGRARHVWIAVDRATFA